MTVPNRASPAPPFGAGGLFLLLVATLGARGWAAWFLRWRNLDDGRVLELARNVRDGQGLVSSVSGAANPAIVLSAPSDVPPLWPWVLGMLGRTHDFQELAQWLPLGLYGLAIVAAWIGGRAMRPGAIVPSLSPRVHGGHVAAVLVAFEPSFLAGAAQAGTVGFAFFVLTLYLARLAVRRGRAGLLHGFEEGVWLVLLALAAPPFAILALGVVLWRVLGLVRGPGRVSRGLTSGALLAGAAATWMGWTAAVGTPSVEWAFDAERAAAVPDAAGMVMALGLGAGTWMVLGALGRKGLLAVGAAVAVGVQVARGGGVMVESALVARDLAAQPDRHVGLVAWLKQHTEGKGTTAVLMDEETAIRIGWRLKQHALQGIDRDMDFARVQMLATARKAAYIIHAGPPEDWRFRRTSAGRLEQAFTLRTDSPDGYTILEARPAPVAQTPPAGKVLLIGVDGGSWKVMGPLVAAGELPTFARLYREGASMVEFDTMESQDSPVVWTSVATGRRPKDHGVKDYTEEVAGVGKVPITSNSRKVPAIWTVATAAGRTVEVVNWWASWPAEPVNGVILSDHANPAAAGWMAGKYFDADTEALKARLQDTFPGELAATLAPYWIAPEAFPLADFTARSGLTPAQVEQLVAAPYNERTAYSWLKTFYTLDEPHKRIAVDHLRSAPADLTMVYLRGPDPVQHYAWNLVEPWLYATPPATLERDRGLVEATYRYTDSFVGELIEAAGPDTTVIVMSDHGAEPCSYAVGKNSKKRPGCHRSTAKGILFMTGPGVKAGGRITHASPMDIAPTLAWLAGLPVSREMPGRVLSEAFSWEAAAAMEFVQVDDWGDRVKAAEPTTASPADGQMLEQLRGLGYIE